MPALYWLPIQIRTGFKGPVYIFWSVHSSYHSYGLDLLHWPDQHLYLFIYMSLCSCWQPFSSSSFRFGLIYTCSWINIPKISFISVLWLVLLNGSKCAGGSCVALYPEYSLPVHLIPRWMTTIQYPVCYQWDYTGMLTTGNLLSKGLTTSHFHWAMTQR